MSLNCNNVRDYVTLYKDGILSGETAKDITEHLSCCKDCKKYYKEYDGMNTSVPKPEAVVDNDADYALVAKKMRKKRLYHAILMSATVLASVAVTAVVSNFLFSKDD